MRKREPRADSSLQPQGRLPRPRTPTPRGSAWVWVAPSVGDCPGLLSVLPSVRPSRTSVCPPVTMIMGLGCPPWAATTVALLAWALRRQRVECRPCRSPAAAQAACSSPAPPVRGWGPGTGARCSLTPTWQSQRPPPLPRPQPGAQLVSFRPRGVWSGSFPSPNLLDLPRTEL